MRFDPRIKDINDCNDCKDSNGRASRGDVKNMPTNSVFYFAVRSKLIDSILNP